MSGDRPAGWDSLNLGNNQGAPLPKSEEVWPGQEPEQHEHFQSHSQDVPHVGEQFGEGVDGHQRQYHDDHDAREQHDGVAGTYVPPHEYHQGYDRYHDDQDEDGQTGRRPIPLMAKLIFGFLVLVVVGLVALSLMATRSTHRDDNNVEVTRPTVEPISPPRKIGSDPMTDLARPVTPLVSPLDDLRKPQPVPAAQPGMPDPAMSGTGIPPDQRRYNFKPDPTDALTADVQALRDSLATANAGLSERATTLEDKVAVLTYKIAVLEADIQALKTLLEEKKATAGKGNGSASAKAAAASAPAKAAQKVASARRAEAVITEGKKRCVLNGATDGVFEADKKPRAWITGESGQMAARAVGDVAPCVGQIRSIRAEDDTWVVVGDKGTLRLHTSEEGR